MQGDHDIKQLPKLPEHVFSGGLGIPITDREAY